MTIAIQASFPTGVARASAGRVLVARGTSPRRDPSPDGLGPSGWRPLTRNDQSSSRGLQLENNDYDPGQFCDAIMIV